MQVTGKRLLCTAVWYVATCVWVAWRCFQAGGCDIAVVPRPVLNLLLPELDDPVYVRLLESMHYYGNFDSASGSEGEMDPQ